MMTKFGKRALFLYALLICIIIGLIIYIFVARPNDSFSLTDYGYEQKPGCMLMMKDLPAGRYYLECTSGYGIVYVENSYYQLRNDKIKIYYSNNFLNDYYACGCITIPRDDCVISAFGESDEDFTVKFKYVGDKTQ